MTGTILVNKNGNSDLFTAVDAEESVKVLWSNSNNELSV